MWTDSPLEPHRLAFCTVDTRDIEPQRNELHLGQLCADEQTFRVLGQVHSLNQVLTFPSPLSLGLKACMTWVSVNCLINLKRARYACSEIPSKS